MRTYAVHKRRLLILYGCAAGNGQDELTTEELGVLIVKITMITIGSTGDVRPYMLLGRELCRRGHEVTVAAFAPFKEMITGAGLTFFHLSGDVVDLMEHLMKPGAVGMRYLKEAETAISKVAEVLLHDLMKAGEGADAIVCNFFGNTVYSVAEKYGIPCVQTHFFPMDPCSDMPISSAPFPKLGRWWNRLSYRIGYVLISVLEKRYLTAWRKENGVSLRRLHCKPDYTCNGHRIPAIYATSPLLMPRPACWDEHIHMSGFWWEDTSEGYMPPQALADFLAAGDAPIYVGFGSMVSGDMQETFRMVHEAIEMAGVRAVVATGWAGEQQPDCSGNVFYVDKVPHDWLFQQVSAAVHHGGAGTTASSLRAGLPTLVVPFGGDQPFWGDCVRKAGCGPEPLPRDHMTADELALRLRDLRDNAAYREKARAMGKAMRQEHGTQTAADIIEREVALWLEADRKAEAGASVQA